MPNKENIYKVRDAILDHPKNFNMDIWIAGNKESLYKLKEHKVTCGTCACIGGWAQVIFTDNKPNNPNNDFHTFEVAQVFGISIEDANNLCYPSVVRGDKKLWNPYGATAKQAAKVLNHLAETGTVDWRKAID